VPREEFRTGAVLWMGAGAGGRGPSVPEVRSKNRNTARIVTWEDKRTAGLVHSPRLDASGSVRAVSTHKRETQLDGHLEAKGICIPGSAQYGSKIELLASRDCKESSNIFKLQNCRPGEGDGQASLLYPACGGAAYPPLFPLRAHQNHIRTRSLPVV
jgi:hypothetical protein